MYFDPTFPQNAGSHFFSYCMCAGGGGEGGRQVGISVVSLASQSSDELGILSLCGFCLVVSVADELGYFVKNASNQTFVNDFGEFFCGTIDLTNPAAYKWYKDGRCASPSDCFFFFLA